MDPPAPAGAPAVPEQALQRLLQARRRGAVPGAAGRSRGRPDQRPGGPRVQRLPAERLGDVRLPRAGGRPGDDGRAARGRLRLAARAGPRPRRRPDGLHDARRVRRARGRLRAAADGAPALAPALLPRALRAGRAREGGGPLHVGAAHLGQGERAAGDLGARREGRVRARDPACAGCSRRTAAAATSTCSPRSTTRPGRATGASCPSRRRTWTPTPRSCISCSTPTGSWSPRPPTARPWARRSRSRTSTRSRSS